MKGLSIRIVVLIILLEIIIFGFLILRGTREINNLLGDIEMTELPKSQGQDTPEEFDVENMVWDTPGDAPWSKRDAHTSVVFNNI